MAAASVKLRLHYESLEVFVDEFALFVARAGMFLPTNSAAAVGDEVKFEVRLANDFPALIGVGTVQWHRPATSAPKLPAGIGVRFSRMTRESRDVVMSLLTKRLENGFVDGPDGLPQLPLHVPVLVPAAIPAPRDSGGVAIGDETVIAKPNDRWGEFASIAQRVDVEAALRRARELCGDLGEADLDSL